MFCNLADTLQHGHIVVCPGIGDVIEGGEEDVHVGNGLQKGNPRPRIHPPENRKTPRIRSNPKRDSPACQPRRNLRFWQTGIILSAFGMAAACYCGLGKDQEDFRWSRP